MMIIFCHPTLSKSPRCDDAINVLYNDVKIVRKLQYCTNRYATFYMLQDFNVIPLGRNETINILSL